MKRAVLNNMSSKKLQQGTAAAIMVFILMVVVAGMLTASLYSSSSSVSSSTQYVDHQKALYLAESALERVKFEMENAVSVSAACEAVPLAQTNFSTGSFEVLSGVDIIDGTTCTVRVKGTHQSINVFLESIFFNSGGSGVGVGGGFLDQFISNADFNNWTQILTLAEGTARYDANNCPSAVCSGSAFGSFYIETSGSGGKRDMKGYIERAITTIDTGATGMLVDVTGGYLKQSSNGVKPKRHQLFIELFDSTNNIKTELWRKTNKVGSGTFKAISKQNFSLPANRLYDSIRIRFNFRGVKTGGVYAHPQAYVDEVQITSAGGGAPDWNISTWKIVDQ